jgi:hypothetical protein
LSECAIWIVASSRITAVFPRSTSATREGGQAQTGHRDRDPKPVVARSVPLDTYLRTRVRFVFADGGFAGRLLDWANAILRTTLHIVRKPADQRGFAVIPRRGRSSGPLPG